jgi:hypothetical protein
MRPQKHSFGESGTEAANGLKLKAILSFTQKSGEVLELGGSLAKKAFRAKKIPSPRRGGGLGWGGNQLWCSHLRRCVNIRLYTPRTSLQNPLTPRETSFYPLRKSALLDGHNRIS